MPAKSPLDGSQLLSLAVNPNPADWFTQQDHQIATALVADQSMYKKTSVIAKRCRGF